MDSECLLKFVAPYYQNKDIMHNIWHIELVIKYVNRIISQGQYHIDHESLIAAAFFHGFFYSDKLANRRWLTEQNVPKNTIETIIKIAWESQRPEIPQILEGKILHDAHVIEGGKTYLITKSLITGSVRGQSLEETITFIEENVLDHNQCYLPESIPICVESNQFAKEFIATLKSDISADIIKSQFFAADNRVR